MKGNKKEKGHASENIEKVQGQRRWEREREEIRNKSKTKQGKGKGNGKGKAGNFSPLFNQNVLFFYFLMRFEF